ncbi:Ubiquitin carboxyl-terminal hydrolase 1 [Pseudocercospora fuligena]|uniref:ubiquitinyl hydrolase 1 n=1 Tax=Pseudocercospora fuligena TaxID=685502 RepID=A0A8H6RMI8_9PEZI|nr:Ubiquitin carboxyl-terminal hydrolase 1 [Pseudocercospora fuligena]
MDQRLHYHHTLEPQPVQLSVPRPSIASSIAGTVLLIYLLNFVLQYFDAPVLPLQQIIWNAIVYVIPTPLLLDPARRQELKANDMLSQTHAAKSDALRRMLGLGGNAILQSLPQAGEAIGLGSVGRRLSMAVKPAATSNAPAGLGNWDNSCYQNSVLQALASLRGLENWLQTAEPPESDADSTTNTALQQLLGRLRNQQNNGRHIWTPAKLKNMSSWQQQDAQEYFSKIMDELDKEAKRAIGAQEDQPGLEAIVKRDRKGEGQDSTEAEVQAMSMRNPLEGLVAQRVACTSCGFSEGYSMIPFNCLTVPLGSSFAYDLEECLDEYTKSEDIEGVECRCCTLMHAAEKLQKLIAAPPTPLKVLATPFLEAPVSDTDSSNRSVQTPATSLSPQTMALPPELRTQILARLQAIQQALDEDDFSDKTIKQACAIPAKAFVNATKSREAVIGRMPQTLVIHINRSVFDEMTGMQRKNYAQVRYPMLLDLRPWMLEIGDAPPQYELSAVIQHYGRHENGHYICYRRHPGVKHEDNAEGDSATTASSEEKWWRLSDEDVSAVSEQEVLDQSGAFMLFYERLPLHGPPQPISEDIEDAAAIPLPPDEAADWDMISVQPLTDATPSLVTSSTQSVVSESDIDTEIDEPDPEAVIPSAGKLPLPQQAPILKTAGPAVMALQDDMKVMNRMMRV